MLSFPPPPFKPRGRQRRGQRGRCRCDGEVAPGVLGLCHGGGRVIGPQKGSPKRSLEGANKTYGTVTSSMRIVAVTRCRHSEEIERCRSL